MDKLRKISGTTYKGHVQAFRKLIDEFDDIVWAETSLGPPTLDGVWKFKTGLVGRNYERQRKFVQRLNSVADIIESEYGMLKNGNIN